MQQNVVLIGSGHVATHLGLALKQHGHQIRQVFSRQLAHAEELATNVEAQALDTLDALDPDADLYIIAVSDQAIPEIIATLPQTLRGIVVHTSGSTAMNVFPQKDYRHGVLYPVQTFSKAKAISFDHIPLAIEASDPATMATIEILAQSLSDRVFPCDSNQRMSIHIAAVFACNFTNQLYQIAQEVLNEQDLAFDLIRPLILETAEKAMQFDPHTVQTGPAVREDYPILQKHAAFLAENKSIDSRISTLYNLITELIIKSKKKPEGDAPNICKSIRH